MLRRASMFCLSSSIRSINKHLQNITINSFALVDASKKEMQARQEDEKTEYNCPKFKGEKIENERGGVVASLEK